MRPSINIHIANSTGKLDNLLDRINSAFYEAKKTVEKELKANQIDVVFIYSPFPQAEMRGVSGSSRGPNLVLMWINSDINISQEELYLTLLHEIHHCIRQRTYKYGVNLGETIVYEGLATLYEEEHGGNKPVYAKAKIKKSEIDKAVKNFKNEKYSQSEWFFGSSNITKWFGYTFGYNLCEAYSKKVGKKAAELVDIDPSLIIGYYSQTN
jgi:uncharacterized protein YjaZ